MNPRKKYYTVEIMYRSEDTVTGLYRITNLDGATLQTFRENMCLGGVYRKIDDDTGEIILPWNIIKCTIYRQAHFFSASADVPLHNPKPNNSSTKK